MKKILSVILAAASVFTMSTAVFAETAKPKTTEAATVTFDTDVSLDYIHTFGNAEETNLTCTLSDTEAISGRCLELRESFTGSIGNQYGGFYIEASDLGLSSFAGYTMNVNIKATSDAAKATDMLLVFSDGSQWVSEDFLLEPNMGKWTSAKVSVPADKNNTKMGISIPITSDFDGRVALIDNITITDNYGKAIANIGDVDTSLAEAPNTFVSVITTILFIILILAVLAGVALVVVKALKRYR